MLSCPSSQRIRYRVEDPAPIRSSTFPLRGARSVDSDSAATRSPTSRSTSHLRVRSRVEGTPKIAIDGRTIFTFGAGDPLYRAAQRAHSTIRARSETESGPGFKIGDLVVVPLWYRLLCPMRPDRPRPGTMGTPGRLADASTPEGARLGAERSPVQIRPPRLGGSPLLKRACGISGDPWASRGSHVLDRDLPGPCGGGE
jgi:hypothetical protein